MKYLISYSVFLLILSTQISAQKYFTKTGTISFYSDTPLEKIEAQNKSSNCVLDVATGRLEFAVLIKGFQFEKALMQEHFNENYMESNKFPKATFKGQIDNYKKIDVAVVGSQKIKVTGDLTIHGVTKKISSDATLTIKGGKISTNATMNIILEDYGIEVPSLVKDQIAKSVKVKVDAILEPLK